MRNVRKLEILEFIGEQGEATSSDLTRALGISQSNASTLLARYHRWGLLNRRRDYPNFCNMRLYRLTETGLKRFEFLKETLI